jgi:hypothetical protein
MRTENFSEAEKRRLKQRLSSYGAISNCAAQAGIHRSTVTRILKTGAAGKEVMGKLRTYLQNNSKLFIELQPEVLRPTG